MSEKSTKLLPTAKWVTYKIAKYSDVPSIISADNTFLNDISLVALDMIKYAFLQKLIECDTETFLGVTWNKPVQLITSARYKSI